MDRIFELIRNEKLKSRKVIHPEVFTFFCPDCLDAWMAWMAPEDSILIGHIQKYPRKYDDELKRLSDKFEEKQIPIYFPEGIIPLEIPEGIEK